MITVSVEADISKAVEMLRLLPQEANRAASSALNSTAKEAQREAIKRIAFESNIARAEVAEHIYRSKASKDYLLVRITAKPFSPNLIRYGARQTKQGVSAAPWRKRRVHKRTFIANAGRTVFVREGKERLPIKSVKGPSVRIEFTRPITQGALLAVISRRWPHYFERALRGQLVRLRGASALRGIANVLPNIAGPVISDG